MNERFVFIADPHHFSRTLSDSGEAYRYRSESDQKCLEETGAIIDAAFDKILADPPASVMIAGDLSNDGERVSHEEFREKLYRLKEKVPVYVITATHDWCCDENPRRFSGDNISNDVDTVPHEELSEFYKDFGLQNAISAYKTHLGIYSYVVQIAPNVRLLALNDDQNGKGRAGYTPEHMAWVEEQIRKGNEDGQIMIGMEHHLLIAHIDPFITSGHCVGDREEVASKLADAGLRYMFVGHSHIQRIDTFVSPAGNPITEVNIGSLCGYPAPIVTVTVREGGRLHIKTDHLKGFEGVDNAQEFLKSHATAMIDRLLEGAVESREEFGKRLKALGINNEKLSYLRPLIKPLAKHLLNDDVMTFYRKVNRLTFGKALNRADAEELKDEKVLSIIHNVLLSFLDGGLNRHDIDSAYYRLVTGTVAIPSKLLKKVSLFQKLNRCADAILTGSTPDPEDAII